jgi:hypothetical protein
VTFDVDGLAQRIADREAVEAAAAVHAAEEAAAAALAALPAEHITAAKILGVHPHALDTVTVTDDGDLLVEYLDAGPEHGGRPIPARIVDPQNPDGAGQWGILRVWPENKPRPRRWTTTASQRTPRPDPAGFYFTPRPTSTGSGA